MFERDAASRGHARARARDCARGGRYLPVQHGRDRPLGPPQQRVEDVAARDERVAELVVRVDLERVVHLRRVRARACCVCVCVCVCVRVCVCVCVCVFTSAYVPEGISVRACVCTYLRIQWCIG